MKIMSLLAALPLFAVMGTTSVAAANVVMPEQLFPQLDAILKEAVLQSPRMLSQALALEIAEHNAVAARAGMLPNVSAYGSFVKAKDRNEFLYPTPGSSTSNSYALTKTPFGVSLSQPLYHWGALKNSARIGEIQQLISRGQYRDAYRGLAQALRAEYLRLVILKASALRSRYYLEVTSASAKQAEDRLAKKVISEAEIFSVRINLERAQLGAERAEFELQNAVRAFARLAGLGPAFTVDRVPDSIPQATPVPDELNTLLAAFLSQKDPVSTEADTLRKQIEVENLNYSIARTRLWPKLGLSAGLSQTEDDNYFGGGAKYKVTSTYVGLNVNWNIFDGFSTQAATRASLARRRIYENDYRQLTERLAQDAQMQVKNAEFSARGMSINDRLLHSGEGNLQAKQDDFGRGVTSEAAVNEAKLGLYDAQINAYTSRREYLMSVGDFLGTVVEDPALANLPVAK